MTNEDVLWLSIQERDRSKDGTFFYGVLTTGIYCKPSCSSRQPLRKNVRFYATAKQAEQDGLRPCLRCQPSAAHSVDAATRAIREICNYLSHNPDIHSANPDLAERAGMSVAHFQRTFKRLVGVTPKQYIDNLRMQTLKKNLKKGKAVTDTVYESGFGSSSRVYERSNTQLGMTPAQYSKGGSSVTISFASVPSQLGRLMLGATDRGLCFVQFGDTHQGLLTILKKEYPLAILEPMGKPYHSDFHRWIESLNRYMSGAQTSLELPVDVRATAFQLRVWQYLQDIPYGEVRSYTEVAAGVGQPSAVRAVASACARNQVALLVPCHRVLRNNGDLGGYRWGLDRKRTLLDLERRRTAAEPVVQ